MHEDPGTQYPELRWLAQIELSSWEEFSLHLQTGKQNLSELGSGMG